MLNILVCIKQVLDPEAPVSAYEIDIEAKRVKVAGVQPVINPYDENALEAALRIRNTQDCRISAISMGPSLAKPVLRKSLAVGADELTLLEDPEFENIDSYATAWMLASYIMKNRAFDIILTGRQAADTNAGVVGSGIAEILGIPSITVVKKIQVENYKLIVEQVTADGHSMIKTSLPALLTISHELGELRSVGIKELMAAQKKPITILTAKDLGLEVRPLIRTHLVRVFKLERKTKCEISTGDTPQEAGTNLALMLKEHALLVR